MKQNPIFLCLLVALFSACSVKDSSTTSSQGVGTETSDRELFGLRGTVKSVVSYYVSVEDGSVKKEGVLDKAVFDTLGNRLEYYHYSRDGKLIYKSTYLCDDRGNKVEWDSYYVERDKPYNYKETYSYDDRGNMIEYVASLWRYSYVYDSRNRKVCMSEFDDKEQLVAKSFYHYDDKDNMTELTRYYNVEQNADFYPKYKQTPEPVVDDENVEWLFAAKVNFLFDSDNRMVEQFKHKVGHDTVDVRTLYSYDAAGHKTEEREFRDSLLFLRKTWSFDGKGDMVESCVYSDSTLKSRETWGYDDYGNILEWASFDEGGVRMAKRSIGYRYDSKGNWTEKQYSDCSEADGECLLLREIDYYDE